MGAITAVLGVIFLIPALEELLYAIRSVHNGDSVVATSSTRRLIGRFLPHLPAAGDLLSGAGAVDLARPRFEEVGEDIPVTAVPLCPLSDEPQALDFGAAT